MSFALKLDAHLAVRQALNDHPCVALRKMHLSWLQDDVVRLVVVGDPDQPADAFDGQCAGFHEGDKRAFVQRHPAEAFVAGDRYRFGG